MAWITFLLSPEKREASKLFEAASSAHIKMDRFTWKKGGDDQKKRLNVEKKQLYRYEYVDSS